MKITHLFLIILTFCCGNALSAAPVSNKIFTLRNIEAQRAIGALNELGIGDTVSKIKNVNAIIVTAEPIELKKAHAVVGLLDTNNEMEIREVVFEKDFKVTDVTEILSRKFMDVGFGNLMEPPIQDKQYKALIDKLDDGKTIILANKDFIDDIQGQMSQIIEGKKEMAAAVEDVEDLVIANDTAGGDLKDEEVVDAKPDESSASTDEFDISELLKKAEQDKAETKVPETSQQSQVREFTEDDVRKEIEQAEKDKKLMEMLEKLKQKQSQEAEINEKENIEIPQPSSEPAKKEFEVSLAEPQIPDANLVLELQLPEKVNIVNLLDLLGEYMGLDYIYDETKIRGDITLKVQDAITIKDLYSYVEAILKSKGFAMVRGRGKLVMIVPVAEAINYDPQIVGKDREVKAGNVFVTSVFELEYIDTATANQLLTEMSLGASIVQVPEAQTLIVTDYAYRMQRIEDLLGLIDRPGEPKEIEFRQIEYISVSNLIPKLEKLAEELGSVGITTTIKSTGAAQPRSVRTVRGRPAPSPQPQPASTATPAEKMVFLEADERTNRIIMIGSGDQIAIVNDLIGALDIKQRDFREIRLYEITNIAAEEVQLKLGELGITGDSQSMRTTSRTTTSAAARAAAARAAAQQQNQPTTTSTLEGQESPVGELAQVILLEATNSLLVNATPEQHEQIQMVIAYVDQVALETTTPYMVYPLENQDPEDLADILNEIVSKTVETKDEQGKIVKVPSTEEQDITIVPDKGTFSIIVYASRKNQEWIGQLIERLDKRRPQVLINVSLVEISNNDSFEYDLDIIANARDSVTGNIGVTEGIITSAVGNEREAGWNTFGDRKALKGFWAEDKIQVLLDTVESKGYGRVLAQPKILVNDNEEGKISTSEETYVAITTQSYPGEGTTPVESTTFDPYEAKIELSITPNIGEGDLLRLTVEMVREDFTETPANAPPDYARSNVNTIVTVPDGSTIILGGLTRLNQGKNTTKIPLLGDLPLVGGAFRSINNSNDSKKLYIFVKANILRPDDTSGVGQLRTISDQNRDEFEEAEKGFQKYQSWPGVEPEPVEPIRVLD